MQGSARPPSDMQQGSQPESLLDADQVSRSEPQERRPHADSHRGDAHLTKAIRKWWPSTLTVVAIAFFLSIGGILAIVWVYGDEIVIIGRGLSILILGVVFIIVLNLIAIVLMLVLLNTIKDRDD